MHPGRNAMRRAPGSSSAALILTSCEHAFVVSTIETAPLAAMARALHTTLARVTGNVAHVADVVACAR